MKKVVASMLSMAMLLSLVTGCAGKPATQETADAGKQPEAEAPAAAESVKTGLAVFASRGNSAGAGEKDGQAQTDITIVAVTVDENGVITDCAIDEVQAKVGFDAAGQITSDLSAAVLSKNELGTDYGMSAITGGKEWNEQAAALAEYVIGKTADEVTGIAVDEGTKPTEADLASSVTIAIGGFIPAITAAVENAEELGAQKGDELRIVTNGSIGSSAGFGEKDGNAQADVDIAAVTMKDGVITSCIIDSVQSKVSFDAAGQITSDVTAPVATKNQLGTDYGMSAITGGKEWNEQAAAFAAYVTGKSVSDVAGIAVDEGTKPTEADLAATVTIAVGGFQALLAKLG